MRRLLSGIRVWLLSKIGSPSCGCPSGTRADQLGSTTGSPILGNPHFVARCLYYCCSVRSTARFTRSGAAGVRCRPSNPSTIDSAGTTGILRARQTGCKMKHLQESTGGFQILVWGLLCGLSGHGMRQLRVVALEAGGLLGLQKDSFDIILLHGTVQGIV